MQGSVASRMPRIVVVSENSIHDIHTDMGVGRDRMRLVPVGVDPDLFRPDRPGSTASPGRLITTASADVALKGLAYLLEAMAKLRTDGDVRADDHRQAASRASDGPHRQARPRRRTSSSSSGVTDERIVELYAEAELAVVPSLYEGFSLPAIEAMSSGICLVATDGGALPEVTGPDGETVLQCRGRRRRVARRGLAPRPRRPRGARRGSATAGRRRVHRALDVAALRAS